MHILFLNDRKALSYECLADTLCGSSLVLKIDPIVVVVKNVTLNGKRKIFVIILGIVISFSDVKSCEVIDRNNLPPQQMVVSNLPNRAASKFIRSVRTKYDLRNPQWRKEFISGIRGGSNEKLIQSILSKVSESDWDIASINKILKRLAKVTLEIRTHDKLLKILAELEKPIAVSPLFVEGWVPQLPRHRNINKLDTPTSSTPSIEFLLDSTKCYGHREGYNTPRSVSEYWATKAIKKVYDTSLKNPKVKKEYKAIKDLLKEGVHPVNLSEKSTYVSSTKVLVKKPESRYIVDVSDTEAKIVGVSSRKHDKCMARFETLMNDIYNLDLTGY